VRRSEIKAFKKDPPVSARAVYGTAGRGVKRRTLADCAVYED
jgi:hypothetical protein